MLDANKNYFVCTIDFNSLEIISTCSSRTDVNAQMNKSAIDDIPPSEINATSVIHSNRPDSIQNTTNHINTLQSTNHNIPGTFFNSTFSGCTFQFTHTRVAAILSDDSEAHTC